MPSLAPACLLACLLAWPALAAPTARDSSGAGPAAVSATVAGPAPPVATSAPDSVARLVGSVVVAGTGAPVSDAEIRVVGTDRRASTDGRGRFTLEAMEAGPALLEVRTGSGLKGRVAVTLAGGDNRGAVLAIRLRPAVLPGLEVEVRAGGDPGGRTAGFARRRERRSGVFLDRAEIERRSPRRTADLLRRMPGVRLERHRWYHGLERIVVDRTPPSLQGPCPVMIYLDGNRLPDLRRFGYRRLDLDLPAPDEIEAMELYTGAGRVPARFAGPGARCGVLAIWTRDPSRR